MKEATLLTDGYIILKLQKVLLYSVLLVNPKGIATLSGNYKEVCLTDSYRDWGREALPDNVKVIEVV